MRYDTASSRFAEFGPFVTGAVGPLDEVLAAVGAVSLAEIWSNRRIRAAIGDGNVKNGADGSCEKDEPAIRTYTRPVPSKGMGMRARAA